jgi:hypothetical protein
MAKAIEDILEKESGKPSFLVHKFTLDGMTDKYQLLLRKINVEAPGRSRSSR